MILKTKGIVLHHIKYRESGIIAHVFLRDIGRQSLLIQGIRGKSSKGKLSLFQPLYILDLEIYYKPQKTLHRIKEVKNHKPYLSIPHNIIKTSIGLFLAEILYHCLKSEEKEPDLFDFLVNSFQILDHRSSGISNFHLVFLLKLSRFLGFYPNLSGHDHPFCFDLKDGIFRISPPNHPFYLSQPHTTILKDLLKLNYEQLKNFSLSNKVRGEMLNNIIDYYIFQEQPIAGIKSIKILREVFG